MDAPSKSLMRECAPTPAWKTLRVSHRGLDAVLRSPAGGPASTSSHRPHPSGYIFRDSTKESKVTFLDGSCLSACFSTPRWVAYRGAQTAVPQEPAAVSAAVRQRGSVRGLSDRVPLARGVRLSQMPSRVCVRSGWPPSLAVRLLPLPGLGDSRDGLAQLEDSAHDMVLGRLLDDDGQAWSLGLAVAAPTWDRPLRDRMDDSPQAPASDGKHRSRASPGRGRA